MSCLRLVGKSACDQRMPWSGAKSAQYLYANIVVYNLAMNIIKVSFLLQYRRLFHGDWTQRICFWLIIYVIIWAVVQDLILGMACLPLSIIIPSTASWCLPTLPIWFFSSGMSIATDLIIFCIPLPTVLSLHIPKKQKILIFGIFCLGFLYASGRVPCKLHARC